MFGSFSPESIELFLQMSCEEKGLDYSETYDFARCQRADGSFYGTRGLCRSGRPSSPSARPQPRGGTWGLKPQPRGGTWVQKGQENKHLVGQKSSIAFDKPGVKDALSRAAQRVREGRGGSSGLSDAQLKAIFAKTGGGKGKGKR